MISNLIKSLKLTIAFCVLFSVCYIFILWAFARVATPNNGNAEVVELNGKVVGAANVGQSFTQDIYFWGRLPARVTATTQRVQPEAIKVLPMKNTWRSWKHVSILSSYIIRI